MFFALDFHEDVGIELKITNNAVPTDKKDGFTVDFVWKSVSFDRFVI